MYRQRIAGYSVGTRAGSAAERWKKISANCTSAYIYYNYRKNKMNLIEKNTHFLPTIAINVQYMYLITACLTFSEHFFTTSIIFPMTL